MLWVKSSKIWLRVKHYSRHFPKPLTHTFQRLICFWHSNSIGRIHNWMNYQGKVWEANPIIVFQSKQWNQQRGPLCCCSHTRAWCTLVEHQRFAFLTRLRNLNPPIFYSLILYYPSFKNTLDSKPYFVFYIKKLGGHVCHSTCVEDRGQLTGIGFHLLPLHSEDWTWVKLRSWDVETLICWAFLLARFTLFICILYSTAY